MNETKPQQLKELLRHLAPSYIIFSILVIGFAFLADEILEKETMPFDEGVLKLIHSFDSPALSGWIVRLTNTSGAIGIVIIMVIVVSFLIIKKDWPRLTFFLNSMIGTFLLNFVLKLIFHRDRPALWDTIVVEKTFSFPSGHSMASSALAFTMIVLTYNTKYRKLTMVLGILYMIMIGFSRLYLGVHYPTDVIGGWIVSLSWVVILQEIMKKYYYGF